MPRTTKHRFGMTTDTSEKGLETLIMRHTTGTDGLTVTPNKVTERPPPYGSAQEYNRAHALDVREAAARLPAEAAPGTAEDDTDPSLDPAAADEEAIT